MANAHDPDRLLRNECRDVEIELRHLRYFVAATEHGSFRKASAALGRQGTTISRAVRDLEDRLGVSLFQRHSGGVHLTLAGKRFLHRTRSALQQVGDGVHDIAALGHGKEGCIKAGIASSFASGFPFDLLRAYSRDHQDVHIAVSEGNPSEQAAAISQLDLDVAFIAGTENWPDCDTDILWSECVFAVLPEGHPLVGKGEIGWRHLSAQHLIASYEPWGMALHDLLAERLAGPGYRPDIEGHRIGRDNLLSLVALGYGVTLATEAMTAMQVPTIVYRPITGEVIPFGAVWSPRNDNPALRRLLSMARAMSNAAAS